MTRSQLNRLTALAALLIAALAILVLILSGGSTYVLHARFYDAGQLVSGDLVTVGGHQVGTVGRVGLAPNGLADVELDITDGAITPLRATSQAQIGQLSLTGVANRFVGLTPGPGRPIPDGGILPVAQTHGIVDLDVLLDSLTEPVRAQLQQLIRSGAYLVSAPSARQFNAAVPYLNPALSQTSALASEVVSDRFALARLLSSTADLARTLAAHDADLSGAVTDTAAVLREVAARRAALQDTLTRAPAVLRQGTRVLRDARPTLRAVNATLRALIPNAPPLATLLRRLRPAVADALPVITGVSALVPPARRSLQAFPAAERAAVPAIVSLAAALPPITPILAGLRPYIPDAVAGFFNGVGGATGAGYDANGHYLKAQLDVQGNGGGSLSGLLAILGAQAGMLGPLNGGRTGLLAPCPGGGQPPAADRSNAWASPDVGGTPGTLCNPADDAR
ncbi:MAG TPA: MlaD family protein [Solirubrobacteraceae bacterium]|nr:MlaD family protein [Solirubrobacteraceae bacterium]